MKPDPPTPPILPIAQVLYSQGFGTRRECRALLRQERVALPDGTVLDDPDHELEVAGLVLHVDGVAWPFHARALVLLHKPAGYECSQKPKHHPGVLSLLPEPLRVRGVQPVGRLDTDTTGLLLLTDDGQLLHRWTSPKHHLPKTYEAACKHPVDEQQLQRLVEGVVLHDGPDPVQATSARATGPRDDGLHGLELVLTEGKYHQVKRMVAAVGNRVEALHRPAFGHLRLPADLPPGGWRFLDRPEEVGPP